MKKLRLFLLMLLVAALLAACGGEPAGTEPPTQEVTEAPTEPPTEATEPPTEPLEPITGWHFTEPEGFVVLAATEDLSIMSGPDSDGSSITIMKLNTTVDFTTVNEENFAENLGIFGDSEQPPELHSMEEQEIDGYPGCVLEYTMTAGGITARYIGCFVTDGNLTYAFIFADATADGVWADAFSTAAASLNMLREGEVLPVDTTGLELYDLGCGLSMYAAPGMEVLEQEGFDAFLADDARAIMVIEDNKAEYALYGLRREEYAALYVDGATITEDFEADPYGNLTNGFVNELDDGSVFVYYVVVKNTTDSFWLIQCACPYEMATPTLEDFAQWCATIVETP